MLSLTMPDLQTLITRFQQKITQNPDFKGKVLFDLGADGVIFADTTVKPAVVKTEADTAPLTLTLKSQTLLDMLDGKQDPNLAYMMGKLKIKGPLPLALKLNALLED